MNAWKIECWNERMGVSPVDTWLSKQTDEKYDAILKEIALLELLGSKLLLPHSKA
ncbi:hypothetical protein KBC04_05175 [Candidatus Babeliales bacterium]|nr:hypothetical protein [Candidatus Babeliales bacterium]MBP9844137.1 hypothetical protein [Candidatus Babeliales bacterium]